MTVGIRRMGQKRIAATSARAEECSRRSQRNAVRLVRLRIHVMVRDRASTASSVGPSASNRRRGELIAFAAIAALLILGFACRGGAAGRRFLHRFLPVHAHAAQVRMRPAAFDWSDRYGDGTPDFVRLTDPADQAAFRRWFTLIAAYQAERPQAETPTEITDCASLLRDPSRTLGGIHGGILTHYAKQSVPRPAPSFDRLFITYAITVGV